MNLRDIAKPYIWQGVKLYFLPYRTLAVDIAIRQLEAIEPHFEYVNSTTGEHRAAKPDEMQEAEKQAESRSKVTRKPETPKTDWAQVDLWNTLHNTFVGVLPLIVAADWSETLPPEVAAFKSVYEAQGTPAERWQMFSILLGTSTSNALWEGFIQTRDVSFAPEAAPDNAPLPVTPTTES